MYEEFVMEDLLSLFPEQKSIQGFITNNMRNLHQLIEEAHLEKSFLLQNAV